MADTSNLSKFLSDVADAIRTKKETTDPIAAADFDSEILSIESGSGTGDVKLFETVEEMNNSEGNEIGDLAVVYGYDDKAIDINDSPTKLYFPDKVVLLTTITEEEVVKFRRMFFTCTATLNSTSFTFNPGQTAFETITYTSEDGVTYIRNNDVDTLDFGSQKLTLSSGKVTENLGMFMRTEFEVFNGLYNYESGTIENVYALKDNMLKADDKFFDLSDIPISINSFYHIFITEYEVKDAKLNIYKPLNYIIYYIATSRSHTIISNDSVSYLTSYMSTEASYTKYEYSNNVLVSTTEMSGTGNGVVASVNGSTYYLLDELPQGAYYYNSDESNAYYTTNTLPTTSAVEYVAKSIKVTQPKIAKYWLAPTQLTLNDASQLNKGLIAYGENGIIEGTHRETLKMFDTVENMNSSEDNEFGDLAIVYRSEIQNATVDSKFSSAIFPATVVLPEAITDYVDVRYRATDDSVMFECLGEMTSSYFNMSCYSEAGEVNIRYESTDGITYTRVDGGDETVDFGLDIYYSYTEYWNDVIGYFVQVVSDNFDGLFQYTTKEDNSKLQLLSNIICTDTGTFSADTNMDDFILKEDYIGILNEISVSDVGSPYVLYLKYGDNEYFYYIKGERDYTPIIHKEYDNWYLATNLSDKTGYVFYECKINSDKTYTINTSQLTTIGSSNTHYGKNITDIISSCKMSVIYTEDARPASVTFRQNNDSGYRGNEIETGFGSTEKYYAAPTQFTLSSESELLPGKVALGKNGAVTGDGTIYNNLDVNTLNNAYGISLSETYISDYTGNGKNAVSYTPNTQGDKIVNVLRMKVPQRQIKANCNLRLDDNNILSCDLISGTKTLEVYKTNINTVEQTVVGTLDLSAHYVGNNASIPAHYVVWDYDETNKIAYSCLIDRSSTASNYIIFKVDMNTGVVTYINKFNKKYNGLLAISAKNQAVYLCMNTEGLTKTTFSGTQTTIKSGLSLQGDAMAQYRFIPCYASGNTYYIYDVETESFIYQSSTNIAGGGIAVAGNKAYMIDYNTNSTVHIYDIENAKFLDVTADLGTGNNERSFCSYTHRGAIVKNNKAIFSANWAEWLVDISTDTVEFFSRFVMGICVAVDGKDVVALGVNGLCKKMHVTIDENDGGECLAFKTSTGEYYYLRQSDFNRIANSD